jgi:hypothetical protein
MDAADEKSCNAASPAGNFAPRRIKAEKSVPRRDFRDPTTRRFRGASSFPQGFKAVSVPVSVPGV